MSQSIQEKSQESREVSPRPELIVVGALAIKTDSPKLTVMNSGTVSYGVATIHPVDYDKQLAIWTILNEHAKQLDESVKAHLISEDDKREVLKQHEILLNNYEQIAKYKGLTVVVCAGELFIGVDLYEAVKMARERHGKRLYYAESIDLIAVPSLFPTSEDRVP